MVESNKHSAQPIFINFFTKLGLDTILITSFRTNK